MPNEVVLPTLSRSVQLGKAMVFTGSFWVANGMLAIGQVNGPVRIPHAAGFSDLNLEDQTGPMVLDRLLMGENLSASAPVVMPQDFGNIKLLTPTGKRTVGSDNPYTPPDTCVAIIPTQKIGGGLKCVGGVWTRLAGYGVAAAPAWTVTSSGAGNTAGVTSLTVVALPKALPAGTRMVFSGAASHVARSTAIAAAGATTVPIEALPVTIAAAETASVSDPDAIPSSGVFIFRATADFDELTYQTDAGGRMIPTATFQGMYSFQTGLPADMKLGVYGDPMGADLPAVPSIFFFSSP